jgi:hypothetical protein
MRCSCRPLCRRNPSGGGLSPLFRALTTARATPRDPRRHKQGWRGYDTKDDTKTGGALSCPAREQADRGDTSERRRGHFSFCIFPRMFPLAKRCTHP